MPSKPASATSGAGDIHKTIARDYEVIFEQDGRGRSAERIGVLRAVLAREGHFTPENLELDLVREGHPVERDWLNETLDMFVRYGLVWAIRTVDDRVRYEHVHPQRHHDHVICVRCGRIDELSLPVGKWTQDIHRTTGYRVLQGQVQVRGLCPQCVSGRPEVFPLTAAGVGEDVEVVRLDAEGPDLKRLIRMGLCKGVRIQLLSPNGQSGAVVAVDQSRLVVDREAMAGIHVRCGHDVQRPGARHSIPLTDLAVGRSGRIVRIRGQGPIRHRLLEMGVTRGATVFVERVAPLGDPIEVTVKGYYLAIRKEEAVQILVEP